MHLGAYSGHGISKLPRRKNLGASSTTIPEVNISLQSVRKKKVHYFDKIDNGQMIYREIGGFL